MPFPTRFGPGHTKDGGPDRAPPPLYPSTPAVPPEQLPLKPGSDSPPLPPSDAPSAQDTQTAPPKQHDIRHQPSYRDID
ncbi:Uncharacterised protein [Bordetella pseudohinzii]|uniref:Uncharacterized protein n=1 Tax=Bordetella pseudohinzii TaxID=1331258 RepID=A0A0M7CQM8_9BORD|nr:Uncharacterised protein [Bordetella pseudohinzii]